MYFLGVDIGSRTIKAVVVDDTGSVRFSLVRDTVRTARYSYERITGELPPEFSDVAYSVVTGYGRVGVEDFFDETVTEITAHFRGVVSDYPDVATIIDIGGQDSKVLRVSNGVLIDFAMNDRCAAGTGRFLEVMLSRLDMGMEEFASLDPSGIEPVNINATCTVFAESEVISYMAGGIEPEVLAVSVARMVAANMFFMMKRLRFKQPVVMTGGVARLKPVVHFIEGLSGARVIIPESAQVMGAVGAALIAMERFGSK